MEKKSEIELLRETVVNLQQQLADRKKYDALRFEIEQIILFTYKGEALGDIQYYKNAIIDNCRAEFISSSKELKRFITLYYNFFKGVKLSLEEYLFLYNHQVKPEKEIESIISESYNESKKHFKDGLMKKYPDRGTDYNDDEITYITREFALNDLDKLEKINAFYNTVKKSSPNYQKDICENLRISSIDVLDRSNDIELTINARTIKAIESFPGLVENFGKKKIK